MQALSTLFSKITPALTNAMAPQQAGGQIPPGFHPVRPIVAQQVAQPYIGQQQYVPSGQTAAAQLGPMPAYAERQPYGQLHAPPQMLPAQAMRNDVQAQATYSRSAPVQSVRAQPTRQTGTSGAYLGPAVPNLSHLTAEERRKIESVIRRLREEEEKDQRKLTAAGASKIFPLFGSPRRANAQTTMLCALCRRTQFVGDSGNTCHLCGIKTCMRCGLRSTMRHNNQAVWMCNNCKQRQSNWSSVNENAYYGASDGLDQYAGQRPAGPNVNVNANGAASNANLGVRRQMPTIAPYESAASYFHNQPNYVGNSANNNGPSADVYTPRKGLQPSIAREVSTGSSTFVSSPDLEYADRTTRHTLTSSQRSASSYTSRAPTSTEADSKPRSRRLPHAPYSRSASVAALSVKQRTYSLGSCSSAEDYTTTECTSCDELGETESIMSEQNYRSQYTLKESALESIEYHRRTPCLVTWQRSGDETRLIGHMILKKNIPTHELVAAGVADSNGLGLKVVGGRMTRSGSLGAFVTFVTAGGISDMIGRLRVGDQVLEWNNQSLQDMSLDEVYQVILNSKDEPQVEIIAQRALPASSERAMSEKPERGEATRSGSRYHHYRLGRHRLADTLSQPLSETMSDIDDVSTKFDDPCPVHDVQQAGRVQVRMLQDEINGYLIVTVISAFVLQHARELYCLLRLIPETGDVTVRRSKGIARSSSNDARWNQTFVFPAASLSFTDSVFLELSVCDEQSDNVIGQTELQLCDTLLNDEPTWFSLYRVRAQTAAPPCVRGDSTFSDDAVYQDDHSNANANANSRKSLTSRSLHARSHSPRRQPGTVEPESSEYESDSQRLAHAPGASRNARRSPSPRRPNSNANTNHQHHAANGALKRQGARDKSDVDIYTRYQQLIEQSKRERQPRSHSSSTRTRHFSHGSPSRHAYQSENHVASDASESGVSESPQPSVQSVERSKRPNTLPMRPLSDVSEDTLSKDDSVRASDVTSAAEKQPHRSRKTAESNHDDQKSRRRSRPYARSVSAESPDALDEPSTAETHKNGTTKDGNASDSGVATGSATSGNANIVNADGSRKSQQLPTTSSSADEKTSKPHAQSAASQKDAADARRKVDPLVKKGSIKAGNRSSSSSNLNDKKSQFQRSEEVGRAALLRTAGASRPDLTDTDGFIDGLGPGQILGRQALGATCLGEIQLSLLDRKGSLEVEVIRCRNLAVPKNVGKTLPACYVKLYLMDNKHCLEKQRTIVCQKRSLEPVYQQKFSFTEVYKERTLQVMIWGDYARTDRKVFMGVAQINLGALDLRKCMLAWYKLYPANSIVGGVAE